MFRETSEPRPASAGRMGDHRIRPRVEPSIAGLVPHLDAGQARVHAVRLHEKGCQGGSHRCIRQSRLCHLRAARSPLPQVQ